MNKWKQLTIVLVILIMIIVTTLLVRTYTQFQKSLIDRQQEQLLSVVRSVAINVKKYIENDQNSLLVLSESYEFKIALAEYLKSANNALLSIQGKSYILYNPATRLGFTVYDTKGNEIAHAYHDDPTKQLTEHFNINTLHKVNDQRILNTYKTQTGTFALAIAQALYKDNSLQGWVVEFIDLADIYNTLVAPAKADEKGYVMVKDDKGIILMYPLVSHIGMHAINDRANNYPNVDFSSMNELIRRELLGKEDTFIYDFYWFYDDKPPEPAKKFSAFEPLYLDEGFWVIASNMDYNTFVEPSERPLIEMLVLFTFISSLLFIGVFLIFTFGRKQYLLGRETTYLRDLNQTLEDLNRSEEKVHHYEKLNIIGTMTSGIAHEFNNLLTPILGFSDLLQDQLDPNSLAYSDVKEIYMAAIRAK